MKENGPAKLAREIRSVAIFEDKLDVEEIFEIFMVATAMENARDRNLVRMSLGL